jgi:hypothetical protein
VLAGALFARPAPPAPAAAARRSPPFGGLGAVKRLERMKGLPDGAPPGPRWTRWQMAIAIAQRFAVYICDLRLLYQVPSAVGGTAYWHCGGSGRYRYGACQVRCGAHMHGMCMRSVLSAQCSLVCAHGCLEQILLVLVR